MRRPQRPPQAGPGPALPLGPPAARPPCGRGQQPSEGTPLVHRHSHEGGSLRAVPLALTHVGARRRGHDAEFVVLADAEFIVLPTVSEGLSNAFISTRRLYSANHRPLRSWLRKCDG